MVDQSILQKIKYSLNCKVVFEIITVFYIKVSSAVFQKFCQTQWPAPEEYSQLEAQTSLGRTDIVRWFKDHRSALKSGENLDWMESLKSKELSEQQRGGQEQNGRAADKQQCLSSEVKPGKRKFGTPSVESYSFVFFFSVFINAPPSFQWSWRAETHQRQKST